MPTYRQQIGRYGGHKSWANTSDRSARTAAGRRAGPSSVDCWLDRLDPDRFANATDEQRLAAAIAARKAFYAELSLKSAKARKSKGSS
jgi:hypothetical protein